MTAPTPDKANLLALARLVEAAEGPSADERQLVIDAFNLVFPHEMMLSEEQKGDDKTRFRRTMHRAEFTNFMNTDYHRASLDAAMMLVPEGWSGKVWFHPEGQCWAEVWRLGELIQTEAGPLRPFASGCSPIEGGPSATPALALTASALRAQAASQ